MTGSSSRSGDRPRRRFRMKSGARSVWSICAHVTVAVGLVCTVARWGWVGPISAALLLAIMVASAAAAMLATDTRELPRMMLIGLVAGVGLTAMGGLVAVFEVTGLCVVLLVVATCPAVHARVRRVWRSLTATADAAEADPTAEVHSTREDVQLPHHTATLPEDLGSLDDVALCLAWRRSFLLLQAARSVEDRMIVVEQRRQCLEELERRCPGGVEAWLSSGARASGNPLPFLGDRPDG